MTSAAGPPPPGGSRQDAAGYADGFAAESPAQAAARHRAVTSAETSGTAEPVEPAVGAVLAVLAASVDARAVVSLGSGSGVTGLWLLRGMRSDGVLTVLDGDPAELRAARRAFGDAGIARSRTRLIFGTAAEVLPRLSSEAYDLVTCSGPPADWSEHLAVLLGLVRAGGSLVCCGVLEDGKIADRSARDPQSMAWREVARTVREDETLISAVLPIGTGLLVASKRR
ncbi:class I SAM-dependent methyltransferase [Modestobacter lapidis]|nr:methyltransferase [Modestobacter lapidis]